MSVSRLVEHIGRFHQPGCRHSSRCPPSLGAAYKSALVWGHNRSESCAWCIAQSTNWVLDQHQNSISKIVPSPVRGPHGTYMSRLGRLQQVERRGWTAGSRWCTRTKAVLGRSHCHSCTQSQRLPLTQPELRVLLKLVHVCILPAPWHSLP